jgi:ubiquinone/menaquinone biosynthesis C-methylase UbiE
MRGTSDLPVELKYELYESSVQCHEADIDFLNEQFKNEFGRKPKALREDFCGTAALACDWVKQSPKHFSYGIDLDSEPIKYGQAHHYAPLSKDEKQRMSYIEGNVLQKYDFTSDIVVAFNFSYFIFKKRQDLLKYFKRVRKSLGKDGAFFVDIFGGTECCNPLEEETEHESHTYYWDCEKFNPLTNEVLYYIHFKKDGHKYKQAFVYDWRMWSVKEISELMEEAGFSKIKTFWEGDDDDGTGDGKFHESKEEENCESWVTYIMGIV